MDAGDIRGLERHLRQHPALLSETIELSGTLPGAYFAAPRLLWFVAENPVRRDGMPPNVVDVARCLIALAREVRASKLADDLQALVGLVASGRVARETGQQEALIRLAVAEGASPDAAMRAALGHREWDAARTLLACGAAQSLEAAAALGDLAALERGIAAAPPESKQRALSAAVLAGSPDALRPLLAAGADPNLFNPDGFHAHSTPLHQAVFFGYLDLVDMLLAAGADPEMRDKAHNGTALGWARHAGRPEMIARIEAASAARPPTGTP